MNVFKTVKENVTARMVAEYYGIKVGRNGLALCPFHPDKNPSLKVDKRFFCFGCGVTGDAIDFVGKYFNLSAWDSAVKICEDFSLVGKGKPRDIPSPLLYHPPKTVREIPKETRDFYFNVISKYYCLLRRWKEEYRPKDVDANWHPLFIKALREIDYTEYLLEILLFGDENDRAFLISDFEGDAIQGMENLVKDNSQYWEVNDGKN